MIGKPSGQLPLSKAWSICFAAIVAGVLPGCGVSSVTYAPIRVELTTSELAPLSDLDVSVCVEPFTEADPVTDFAVAPDEESSVSNPRKNRPGSKRGYRSAERPQACRGKCRRAVSDSSVIGEELTGFSNHRATITSSEPRSVQLTNAIRSGALTSGLMIVDEENADYILGGEVSLFWVDEYTTGYSPEYSRAAVLFDVILRRRDGRVLWAKSVDVRKRSQRSFLDTTYLNRATLQDALEDAVVEVFGDPSLASALTQDVINAASSPDPKS